MYPYYKWGEIIHQSFKAIDLSRNHAFLLKICIIHHTCPELKVCMPHNMNLSA